MSANEQNEDDPPAALSKEEEGRQLYQLAVAQSHLNYLHRYLGVHMRYAWSFGAVLLGHFSTLSMRLLSKLTVVGVVPLQNEIISLLDEVRNSPSTMLQMWSNGDFFLPFYSTQQFIRYFYMIRKEFNSQWKHTSRNVSKTLMYASRNRRCIMYAGSVSILSLFTLYHYKMRPWPKHCTNNELDCLHKTVVITGASSGIGYRLAFEFLRRGAFVVLTSPDMVKARKAKLDLSRKLMKYVEKQKKRFMDEISARYYDQVELPFHLDIDYLLENIIEIELNLASTPSIYSFCRKVQGMSPDGIDLLINNAAINAPPEEIVITDEGKEAHFAVNYFGHFVLTNLLLSLLAKRKGARIINVSCKHAVEEGFLKLKDFIGPYLEEEGLPILPAKGGYANSKLAMYLFSRQLAKELQLSGVNNVTTYSVCPGTTRTFLGRYTKFNSSISRYWNKFTCNFSKKPLHAVQPILHCALSPCTSKESGFFYENNEKILVNTRHSKPEMIAQALWSSSIELMAVGHASMLKLTEQMHVVSQENIFQLAKDMFLYRRDVMTHLLLTEEKNSFTTNHQAYSNASGDARNDYTYFWNGFYLSGGERSSLVERWVLYNTHPGFRALQKEYDIWFECTGSSRFKAESSGKMASLQYMSSMPAPLNQEDIEELQQVYESDPEPDEEMEEKETYHPDFIAMEEFI